jgi:hypothetical protein
LSIDTLDRTTGAPAFDEGKARRAAVKAFGAETAPDDRDSAHWAGAADLDDPYLALAMGDELPWN